MNKEIINSIKNKLSKEEIDFILKNDTELKSYLNHDNIGRYRVGDNKEYCTISLGTSNFIQYYKDTCKFDESNFNNYSYFINEVDAQKYAKLVVNYLKIMQTLEYVNGDWKPIWNDEKMKYTITLDFNCVEENMYNFNEVLSFESEEKRKQFRQLISDEEIKLFLNPLGEI